MNHLVLKIFHLKIKTKKFHMNQLINKLINVKN